MAVDGRPISWTKWVSGEPNNYRGNEDGVIIWGSRGRTSLNDIRASYTYRFVCLLQISKSEYRRWHMFHGIWYESWRYYDSWFQNSHHGVPGQRVVRHAAMEIDQEGDIVTYIVRTSTQTINRISYLKLDSNILYSKKSKNNNVQINLRPSGILSMGWMVIFQQNMWQWR